MSTVGDLAYKHINVPGIVEDALKESLKPALLKLVQSTDNPFDDVLMAALYEPMQLAINSQVKESWDKALAPEVPAA